MNSVFLKIFISLVLLANPLICQRYCVIHEHFLNDCACAGRVSSLNRSAHCEHDFSIDRGEDGDSNSLSVVSSGVCSCASHGVSCDSSHSSEQGGEKIAFGVAYPDAEMSAEYRSNAELSANWFCEYCFQDSDFCESKIFDVCYLSEDLFQLLLFLTGTMCICFVHFQTFIFSLRKFQLRVSSLFSVSYCSDFVRNGLRLHLLKTVLLV